MELDQLIGKIHDLLNADPDIESAVVGPVLDEIAVVAKDGGVFSVVIKDWE